MPTPPSLIFLAGPPGSGKSTLGLRVCAELSLRFLDLAERAKIPPLQALSQLIAEPAADLIELPWELQMDGKAMKDCRRAGTLVALWDHPLEMQARSGCGDALFMPGRQLSTHGGFGRRGTSCLEYRRLNRACDVVLDLVGLGLDDAAEDLRELIVKLRQEASGSPAAQEGLEGWGRAWKSEYSAKPDTVAVLLDAMARFLQDLEQRARRPGRCERCATTCTPLAT